MLFIREEPVRDQVEMDAYTNMNRASPRDSNITPLVIYGAIEGLEGVTPDGLVMLQFPTVEDAKA